MALPPKFKTHRLIFTDTPTTEPFHTLELYWDYICPFSARMYHTLTQLVLPQLRTHEHISSRLQIILRPLPQPWHPSSILAHEVALAVSQNLKGDSAAFWAFVGTLFGAQHTFFDEGAAHESRNTTYRRLCTLAQESMGGKIRQNELVKMLLIKENGALEGIVVRNDGNKVTKDLETVVGWGRMAGVHKTPTLVFDGVVVGDGELHAYSTMEEWVGWLEKQTGYEEAKKAAEEERKEAEEEEKKAEEERKKTKNGSK